MPCNDGGGPNRTVIEYRDVESQDSKKRRDMLARMLCDILKSKSVSEIKKLPKETQDWWRRHQAQDRLREKNEAERKHRNMLKRKALSKLSAKERKLLNL